MADHEARGMALNALQAIQSHERLCAERAKFADAQRTRMESQLNALVAAQTRQLIAVIAMLVTALAFFLVPYFQMHG